MRLPGMFLAAGLGLALGDPASAQFSLEPDWARRPDESALSDRYPILPLHLEIEGRVTMACDVTATGAVTSCVVHEEAPKGFGFGEAAKRMAVGFDMRPGISVSRATPHGTVRFPINFKLPVLPPAPPPPQLSPDARALAARLAMAIDPIKGSLEHMAKVANDTERRSTAGTTPADRAEAARALRAATAARAAAGRREVSELIAARMSEADLAAAVTFMESPLAKRWFGEDPVFQGRLKQAWNERGVRFRADAQAAFCRKLDCSAREDKGPRPAPVRTGPGESAAVDPNAPLAYAPWERRPGLAGIVRGWPISYMFGLDGYARALCVINPRGGLDECEVVYETPGGMGVGEALLRQADEYRTTPEFLQTGVGRKVFIYGTFSGLPTNVTADPPVAVSPERQALAARLAVLQESQYPGLADDPDFAKALEPLGSLDPKTRAAAEAAMREAADRGREDFRKVRARLIAEAFDDDSLRRLIRYEEGPGRALRKAVFDARADLDAFSRQWGSGVAQEAQAAYCKSRDCTAPPLHEPTAPPPPPLPPR